MGTCEAKVAALDELGLRGRITDEAYYVSHFLRFEPDLLERCTFVGDGGFAPAQLVLSEVRPGRPLSLHIMFESDPHGPLGYRPVGDGCHVLELTGFVDIAEALLQYDGEVFVVVELDSSMPAAPSLVSVFDVGAQEQLQASYDTRIQDAVEAEIAIALGVRQLEQALARRDFSACKEIKDRLYGKQNDVLRDEELSPYLTSIS